MSRRIAIAGGGPAGLAAAIEARRRGLEVTVFERRTGDHDKACGEGLMPSGVDALARLGALQHLERERSARFEGIRYLQEDGTVAEGRFRAGSGLGVRRTALARALRLAAEHVGAHIVEGAEVRSGREVGHAVELDVSGEKRIFDLLVVADGLASPLRHKLGLELAVSAPRRFGIRRHFAGVQTPSWVEVHWARGVECYVTPVGPNELGVAFLWTAEPDLRPTFDTFLARFPRVAAAIAGGTPSSELRGSGPMARRARTVATERIALIGDAAGYLDAITGEGLSLAFCAAELLGRELVAWTDGDRSAPRRYARAHAQLMRRYRLLTATVLRLARWPTLRVNLVRQLAHRPGLFDAALGLIAHPG